MLQKCVRALGVSTKPSCVYVCVSVCLCVCLYDSVWCCVFCNVGFVVLKIWHFAMRQIFTGFVDPACLDCSLTAQQHKSYLLSPVKFFSPEHTCRSYDEASCSSGNTSGMQREATHVQSMCQAGAKSAPLDITHSKHVALTICAHHVHMVSRSFVLF